MVILIDLFSLFFQISSLKAKQELILDDLKEASDKLIEREDEHLRNANKVNIGIQKFIVLLAIS